MHRGIRCAPPEDRNCFVYGEMWFCDVMAERCGLALLEPPEDFLDRLPLRFLGRDVEFMHAKDVRNAVTERSFVKPANDKVFQYGVYERGSDVPLRYVDPEAPVYVQEPVSWETEVRCYVVDGAIATAAFYRLLGEDEDGMMKQALAFANEALNRHHQDLPTTVVLDVGKIEGRGWAVVEANQLYASGIYDGADIDQVLAGVRLAAGPAASVMERDRQFIRR